MPHAHRAAISLTFATLLSALVVLSGCSSSDPPPSAPPTATLSIAATATATSVPTRTSTALPTSTATAVPTDTATVVPTSTATAEPTSTATDMATPTATPTSTTTETQTPNPSATATTATSFTARGSVDQLLVSDVEPGAEVRLVDADGFVVKTGTADSYGTFIFRDVEPRDGYRVEIGVEPDVERSNAVKVTAPEDAPDQSFYEGQPISEGYGYLITRDGTKLAINVILPGAIERGPYPTVIEYSGYDPANPDAPQPSTLVATGLGYAAVGVNMRGTGCSGGAFQFFEPAQWTDGYDVVETVAAQPWVKNHKVGMVGISYPGITQLFVARLQPPHLAAITPLSVVSDTARGTLAPGGILNNGFATDWAADRQHDATRGGQPWSQKRMNEGDTVCIDNQLFRDQTPDILQMIEENQYYVPGVVDPVSPTTFVDRINVPVYLAGAWQDEQTGGYFPTMLDHFTGTDKLHFTMTNGGHADSLDPTVLSRWMEFLSFYVDRKIPKLPLTGNLVINIVGQAAYGVDGLMADPDRFTDTTSYDEALARFESEPKVRILFDSGAGGTPGAPIRGFERSFDTWPIPGVEPTAWYFQDGGRLDPSLPVGDGADSFVYDPSRSQRTNYHGSGDGVWKALPAWDWQAPDAGKAVAYASDPLPNTLVMAGSGSVDLWLESTAGDTDLQVTLSEIRSDGQEVYIQSGWLRASHRKIDDTRSTELRPLQTHLEADAAPLPAGELVQARVELFPFAHVFRAGSRIRILVGSPGGDKALWKFRVLEPDGPVTNTISHSAASPSRLVLPVVPDVPVTTPLPPCPGLRAQPCRTYQEVSNTPG